MITSSFEFVRRHFSGSLLPALIVAATLSMSSIAVVAQQPQAFLYTAEAFGTTASVGGTVTIGQTAPVIVPVCQTANVPFTKTGHVASLSALPLVSTGVVNTSAADTAGMATGSADVAGISLLAGLISAQFFY